MAAGVPAAHSRPVDALLADVAIKGFDAMMKGDGEVITGWQNRLKAAIAKVLPPSITAQAHGKMAEPGSAR